MRPLTGDDVGVIHGADGWLLICGKKYLENFRQRFPKSTILDIKQCVEKTTTIRVLKKISGGGVTCPELYIGGRGVSLTA